MVHRHRRVFVAVAFFALVGGLGVSTFARAANRPPDPTFARQVTGFMINELVAALFTEFHETDSSTAAAGKQAISLIFNDQNRDMRLVGNIRPLLGGINNLPSDSFEARALADAVGSGQGDTAEEYINGTWYWRTSVPLNPAALSAACCGDPAKPPAGGAQAAQNVCIFCHRNFTNASENVGALMVRVPIK